MIYFWQITFLVANYFSSESKFTNFFFQKIVLEAVSIKGGCQSSGQCCQSIDIYNNGFPITDLKDWRKFLTIFPAYNSFKPSLFNGKIQSFNCLNLDENNRCLDYSNRPQMCRDYPTSYFLTYGKIHTNCGYYIHVNSKSINRLFSGIKYKLENFLDTSL